MLTYTYLLMYPLNIFGRIDKKQLTWSPRGEIEWLGDREVE